MVRSSLACEISPPTTNCGATMACMVSRCSGFMRSTIFRAHLQNCLITLIRREPHKIRAAQVCIHRCVTLFEAGLALFWSHLVIIICILVLSLSLGFHICRGVLFFLLSALVLSHA